jgi:membrane associated rhomboid family serine protease
MAIFRDFQMRAKQSGTPVTVALVVLLIVAYLIPFFAQSPVTQPLAFITSSSGLLSGVWSLLTYPFAAAGDGRDFAWFVISLLWLWGIGGSVERDLGQSRYVAVWLVATLLGAIGLWIGVLITQPLGHLFGPLVPMSTITVIWGTRNPNTTVMLMMVLPIVGRWLAWLAAGIAVFGVAGDNKSPALGVFACLPLLVGYFFASDRLPAGRSAGNAQKATRGPGWAENKKYFDDVKKREKEREERERLRKLFESSIDDDK